MHPNRVPAADGRSERGPLPQALHAGGPVQLSPGKKRSGDVNARTYDFLAGGDKESFGESHKAAADSLY